MDKIPQMKKRAIVIIDINTTHEGRVMSGKLKDGVAEAIIKGLPVDVGYMLQVPAPAGHPHQTDLVGLACHEMGHILGNLLELPGNTHDPRTTNAYYSSKAEVKRDMVASEEEANTLAKEMGLPIDPATMREGLDSYKDAALSDYEHQY